ncbi:NAD(P)H-binding protein [Streptosporangium amethystogenes]|uniref:NAD(P)H-binding protein n=1 Tax=Streptosporangium amethystogenes TaxID=2002 RepID=UPI003791C0EF
MSPGHELRHQPPPQRPGPAGHEHRLEVVGADVLDPAAVDAAVAERDAVLSTRGVPAGKEAIGTCSRGVANIVAAMKRHRVRRLGGPVRGVRRRGSLITGY